MYISGLIRNNRTSPEAEQGNHQMCSSCDSKSGWKGACCAKDAHDDAPECQNALEFPRGTNGKETWSERPVWVCVLIRTTSTTTAEPSPGNGAPHNSAQGSSPGSPGKNHHDTKWRLLNTKKMKELMVITAFFSFAFELKFSAKLRLPPGSGALPRHAVGVSIASLCRRRVSQIRNPSTACRKPSTEDHDLDSLRDVPLDSGSGTALLRNAAGELRRCASNGDALAQQLTAGIGILRRHTVGG